MKNKLVKLLFICTVCGFSTHVNAAEVNFNIEDNTVLSKEDELKIYKSANKHSGVVGYLDKNCSAVSFDEKNGFLNIKSNDIKGWVEKESLITDKAEINNYVLSNLDSFDTEVKTNNVKGMYKSVEEVNDFELNYEKKFTFKNENTPIYRTPSLASTRSDVFDHENYVVVKDFSAKVMSLRNTVWGLACKGDRFLLVDDSDPYYYKVKYLDYYNNYGDALILKAGTEIVTVDIPITNLVETEYTVNQLYDFEDIDNETFISAVFDDRIRYINKEDVNIIYIPKENSSSKIIINKDATLKLSGVVDKAVSVDLKNIESDTVLSFFIDDDNNEYLVAFNGAREKTEERVENIVERHKITEEEKEKFKERYSYDYANNSTEERNEIVNFALQYLGNPYVWGGTSLENGCDCSGYCMRILQSFGKNITRTTRTQCADQYGREITLEEIQPGDLIYYTENGLYPYHVVMYIGGDKCVNAHSPQRGICISDIEFDNIYKIKNYID